VFDLEQLGTQVLLVNHKATHGQIKIYWYYPWPSGRRTSFASIEGLRLYKEDKYIRIKYVRY
jgi:hypothetical protein